jgi:hypothetical protein
MAVAIYTTDGESVIVKGTLGEVQERLIAHWATLVEFELEKREGRVLVSTPHVTRAIESVPATVVMDQA